MIRRSVVFPLVAVVVILAATSGIGFAASSGYLADGSRSGGGTINIAWTAPVTATGVPTGIACRIALSPWLITLTAGPLTPGTSCAYQAYIKNTGTLSAALFDGIILLTNPKCPYFQYGDNVQGVHPTPTVGAGSSFDYRSTFGLEAGAGPTCEGKAAIVLVVISAVPAS